jgi:hypothetical protein
MVETAFGVERTSHRRTPFGCNRPDYAGLRADSDPESLTSALP